jgi:uncharacterized protein (TIGR03086 family)
MHERLDLLDDAIDVVADLMEQIPTEALALPTPCTEYRVGDLFDHLVGWAGIFEAATHQTDAVRDPEAHLVDEDHGAALRQFGHSAVAGLRAKGLERQLVMVSNPIPASMVLDMMTMEYPGHGWDLAVATGRRYPFSVPMVEAAQAAAERMIQPQYRGHEAGQFRPVVVTAVDAPPVERFVAFLGRDPRWGPPAETHS